MNNQEIEIELNDNNQEIELSNNEVVIKDSKIDSISVNGVIQEIIDKNVNIIVPSKTSDLSNDSGFIDNSVNDLTYYYTKTEVDGKVSSVYKYKGSVATYQDLPSTDLTIGDVYNVETDGSNYAWTGTIWDKLGGTIDLSGYQTKIDSSHKLDADLVDDTSSTNKFVSASDKTAWNSKYDKPSGGIPSTDMSSAVQTSLGKADTAIQDISGKQDTLVSGTNIKTINNQSILGSGNIEIQGGSSIGGETLPVGTEVDFDGQISDIPVGWEQVAGKSLIYNTLYENSDGVSGTFAFNGNYQDYNYIWIWEDYGNNFYAVNILSSAFICRSQYAYGEFYCDYDVINFSYDSTTAKTTLNHIRSGTYHGNSNNNTNPKIYKIIGIKEV